MSSRAYEKTGACLALGEAANMIFHNMFVAVRPSADSAVWEWKEAWKGREGRRAEALPRAGPAHCSSLLHNHFLFVFAAPPSVS